MLRWLIFTLFYPWLSAHFWCSYELYSQSEMYANKTKWKGKIYAKDQFDVCCNDFFERSIKEKWKEILFMPWKFRIHKDFI